MITLITGPQGSGKTTKANEIVAGKSVIYYDKDDDEPLCTEGFFYLVLDEFENKELANFICRNFSIDIIITSITLTREDFGNLDVKVINYGNEAYELIKTGIKEKSTLNKNVVDSIENKGYNKAIKDVLELLSKIRS